MSDSYSIAESWAEKYRPRSLDEVVGQDSAVSQIKGMIKRKQIDSTILLTGRTGTGKTTLAMLIAYAINELKYGEPSSDILDFNVGADGGIDNVREILKISVFEPASNFRVIILDEVHRLSNAAASALLKPMEKASKTVWILCTDQPEKLLAPIRGRSTNLALSNLEPEDLVLRLKTIAKKEKLEFINEKHLLTIAKNANAEPRSTINLLKATVDKYFGSGKKDINLAISQAVESQSGIDLMAAKALACVYSKKPKSLYSTLKGLKSGDYIAFGNQLLYYNQFLMEQHFGVESWLNEARKKLLSVVNPKNLTYTDITKIHVELVGIKKELMTFMVPEFDLIMSKLLLCVKENRL